MALFIGEHFRFRESVPINKGWFCNNSEIGTLIYKRLSVENKAKLSPLEIVNKQYWWGVLSFQLRESRFVLYRQLLWNECVNLAIVTKSALLVLISTQYAQNMEVFKKLSPKSASCLKMQIYKKNCNNNSWNEVQNGPILKQYNNTKGELWIASGHCLPQIMTYIGCLNNIMVVMTALKELSTMRSRRYIIIHVSMHRTRPNFGTKLKFCASNIKDVGYVLVVPTRGGRIW